MKIEEMQRLCERAIEALERVSQYRDQIWDQPVDMHSISNGQWGDDYNTIRTAIEQLRKQPQEVTLEEAYQIMQLPAKLGAVGDHDYTVAKQAARRIAHWVASYYPKGLRIIAPPAEKD